MTKAPSPGIAAGAKGRHQPRSHGAAPHGDLVATSEINPKALRENTSYLHGTGRSLGILVPSLTLRILAAGSYARGAPRLRRRSRWQIEGGLQLAELTIAGVQW